MKDKKRTTKIGDKLSSLPLGMKWFLFSLCFLSFSIIFPSIAFADSFFTQIIDVLQFLTTYVLLPVGILIAGSRIIYVAIFCGIMGVDPLNLDPEAVKDPWGRIRAGFKYFAIGLAWVGGIWVVMQIIITVVSLLAGSLSAVL